MSSGGSKEPHEVPGVRVRKDAKGALLVELDNGRLIWVPKSQLDEASEVWREGDEGTLVIPEWLAIDRGIE